MSFPFSPALNYLYTQELVRSQRYSKRLVGAWRSCSAPCSSTCWIWTDECLEGVCGVQEMTAKNFARSHWNSPRNMSRKSRENKKKKWQSMTDKVTLRFLFTSPPSTSHPNRSVDLGFKSLGNIDLACPYHPSQILSLCDPTQNYFLPPSRNPENFWSFLLLVFIKGSLENIVSFFYGPCTKNYTPSRKKWLFFSVVVVVLLSFLAFLPFMKKNKLENHDSPLESCRIAAKHNYYYAQNGNYQIQ